MAFAFSMSLAGCHKKPVEPFLSDLKMSDPHSNRQLLAGFYGLEDGRWRWASHRFAVVLQPPSGSKQTGARLQLQLYIPERQIEIIGPMTLVTDIGEASLAPKKFMKGGAFVYSCDVPSELIGPGLLPVVFTFDKAIQASGTDGRELGAVITEVSLDRRP